MCVSVQVCVFSICVYTSDFFSPSVPTPRDAPGERGGVDHFTSKFGKKRHVRKTLKKGFEKVFLLPWMSPPVRGQKRKHT